MAHKSGVMYAVVGCGECGALWVLEGDPETSECPRCGSRRPRGKRREFFTSEDADAAREARSRMLAERAGADDAFEAVDDFNALEDAIEGAGPDDETYLSEAGLDPGAIADAGERAAAARNRQSSDETVREALRELEAPDEAAVVAYCEERGVDTVAATDLLDRLLRAGEVTKRKGTYRLL